MDMAVESAYLTRLRVAGPKPSRGEINETRTALREGREILRKEGNDRPKPREVIWRLFQDAAETEGKLPLDKRGSLNCWPAIHDLNEMLKVQWEIGLEVAAGVRPAEKSEEEPRVAITDPTAVRRMITVFGWLKACKFKSYHRRKFNTRILLLRARGVTALTISRVLHGRVGERGIEQLRVRLLDQVEKHVSVLDCA